MSMETVQFVLKNTGLVKKKKKAHKQKNLAPVGQGRPVTGLTFSNYPPSLFQEKGLRK